MRIPRLRRVIFLTLVAWLLGACGGTATTGSKGLAQAPAGTLLRKIQDRGKIVIGVRFDVPTLGYLNPQTNQLEGFDVEMGHAIAEYIFGDRNAVIYKEAISNNRIAYLKDGTVDVILSTMTINEEQLQQIDFSVVYYIGGQSLLVPKNSSIKGLADLRGKHVGTVRGSTAEKNIREQAPEAEVSLFDRYADAVVAMDAGQVDAVTAQDVILYGFQRLEPDKWQVVGGQFTKEPYGAAIAKGNTELLDAVNAVIKAMKADGRWAMLYKQWIPSDNVPAPPPNDWQAVK